MTTRRSLLGTIGNVSAVVPLVMLGLSSRLAAADPPTCFDPEKLPASGKNLRNSLGFVTPAPDPAKMCGRCVFFTGSAPGCGTCALLSGGPVTAKSWCRSWAKKG